MKNHRLPSCSKWEDLGVRESLPQRCLWPRGGMVLPDHRSLSTEEPPISTPSLRAASCLFWLGKEVRRQKGKQSPGNRCLWSPIIYKNSGFSKSLTQRNIPSSVHQEQVGRKQIKGPVRLSFQSPH